MEAKELRIGNLISVWYCEGGYEKLLQDNLIVGCTHIKEIVYCEFHQKND
ncbi:MAG: hypothetical protein QNK20_16610 [Aureibaculum sp.]|nr:hypothetical protein [Aureibaculum sp.]